MLFPLDIIEHAQRVVKVYQKKKKKIVAAESCTGGLLSGALTSISGASDVFERGFITYSNDAKIDLLGVSPDLLNNLGAVSDETAEAMAEGALTYSLADVSVSITGVAGPDGGTDAKPVGLVYFGVATRAGTIFHQKCIFQGDRDTIRLEGVREALRLLEAALSE